MADSGISLAARNRHSNLEAVAKPITEDEDESSEQWPSPKVESFFQKWKKIFLASCLFAILLDPLFLYIPMVNDDIKCMLFDRNLKIAALLLRSLTDLFYIFDIIFQIYTSDKYSSFMQEYRGRNPRPKKRYRRKFFEPYIILIDILAILPLPQVAILIVFSEMSDLRSLTAIRMVVMNLFVLLQYVPRVFRIYLSCKELKGTPKTETEETAIWVKGVLNFFMYILSSHVLGAIYYFLAIQRMATCWHNACRKANGCNTSTFGCHDHHTDRNITFLNDLCPISPMNTTLFDFGIYITVLQSGTMGSTNDFQKFSNCFWWGLRNLSSLGSNLQPSVDGWENLFAAFISIIGLLLYLYFIGNLQTYMQSDAHKMKEKDKETELWLSKNGIPKRLHKEMKLKIMKKVKEELEEDRDADMDKIFSILSENLQRQITEYMPMTRLKDVPTLRNMDEDVLRKISGRLEPREFDDNSIIIEKGKPLEMMLFIVDGQVSIGKRDGSSSSNDNLQQRTQDATAIGHVCGEELLRWALSDSYLDNVLPLATESATAIGHVEALVLTASDFRAIRATTKDFKLLRQPNWWGIWQKEPPLATCLLSSMEKGPLNQILDDKIIFNEATSVTAKKVADLAKRCLISEREKRPSMEQVAVELERLRKFMADNFTHSTTLKKREFDFISTGSNPMENDLNLKTKSLMFESPSIIVVYMRSMKNEHPYMNITKHKDSDMHETEKDAIGQSRLFNKPYLSSDYISSISKEGYFYPHFRNSILAEKSDVYSFGVVLASGATNKSKASFSSWG
ncbi:unnamed protein product [Prunus brigantina]